MSKASDALERSENVVHIAHAHAEVHSPNVSKLIGIQIAVMGALLAFCAARVSGARTALVTTMMEQTQAASEEQAQATKYRMLLSQLEQLAAIAPTGAQVAGVRHELEGLSARTPPEQREAVEASRLVGASIATMMSPTSAPLHHLMGMVDEARHESSLANARTAAYAPAVHAYFEAANGFERGQLAAETGIVLSSIALLLNSRKAWYAAVILGAFCALMIAVTYVRDRRALHDGEQQVEHATQAYREAVASHGAAAAVEVTLGTLEHGMSPAGLRVAHPADSDFENAGPTHR